MAAVCQTELRPIKTAGVTAIYRRQYYTHIAVLATLLNQKQLVHNSRNDLLYFKSSEILLTGNSYKSHVHRTDIGEVRVAWPPIVNSK